MSSNNFDNLNIFNGFNGFNGFEDFNELNEFYESNLLNAWDNFTSVDELNKFIQIIKQFDTYEKFYEFMNVMKFIPTIVQINQMVNSNDNLFYFEFLKSIGYFNLLEHEQKYHLFVEACVHDSVDIAMLIFSTGIDLVGVKELMLNYLAPVGSSTEYVIFRKIWEKNIIDFNNDEIEDIFLSILKSSNVEFAQWFYSINLMDSINLNNINLKNKIGWEILNNASEKEDYDMCVYICSIYLNNSNNSNV